MFVEALTSDIGMSLCFQLCAKGFRGRLVVHVRFFGDDLEMSLGSV